MIDAPEMQSSSRTVAAYWLAVVAVSFALATGLAGCHQPVTASHIVASQLLHADSVDLCLGVEILIDDRERARASNDFK